MHRGLNGEHDGRRPPQTRKGHQNLLPDGTARRGQKAEYRQGPRRKGHKYRDGGRGGEDGGNLGRRCQQTQQEKDQNLHQAGQPSKKLTTGALFFTLELPRTIPTMYALR